MIKNALITGASRRIGRAIAIKLAQTGWNIALHYNLSDKDAEELAEGISALGRKAVLVQADLRDENSAKQIVDYANTELGTLTCLVNNASLFAPDTIETFKPDSFHNHMNTNLLAPVLLSQAFAEQIDVRKDGQGNIINIVDQRVMNLRPDYLSYTLSKSALWALTQSMAMALAPGIRVNAIGPGPTLANFRQTETQFRQQCESVPLGYGASEKEIADGVFFLLNAPSITGEFIAMDGGQHLPSSEVKED